MIVIPKQREFIALEIKNTPEFYMELGKYLDKKYYKFERPSAACYKKLYLKYSNDTVREAKEGDYILFAKEDNRVWAYIEKEVFDGTYLILKEDQ